MGVVGFPISCDIFDIFDLDPQRYFGTSTSQNRIWMGNLATGKLGEHFSNFIRFYDTYIARVPFGLVNQGSSLGGTTLWWIYVKLSGWWLSPTPLKNDGVRQLGWWLIPNMMGNKSSKCSKMFQSPPTKWKGCKVSYNPKWQWVKTLYPCSSHQNSWDLWMFIPLKMLLIGIDPYSNPLLTHYQTTIKPLLTTILQSKITIFSW